MKALILNGAEGANEALEVVDAELGEALGARGWEVERMDLRDQEISHCAGCFKCWYQTPGECVIEDDARDVTWGMANGDLVVMLSPVTFGGPSYALKRALDRQICLLSPFFTRVRGETHHRKRYRRYPKLIVVGSLNGGDGAQAATFERWARRMALNLRVPRVAVGVVKGSEDAGARVDAWLEEVEL
jgi:multimeric flavodoxin WrbA